MSLRPKRVQTRSRLRWDEEIRINVEDGNKFSAKASVGWGGGGSGVKSKKRREISCEFVADALTTEGRGQSGGCTHCVGPHLTNCGVSCSDSTVKNHCWPLCRSIFIRNLGKLTKLPLMLWYIAMK